MYNNFNVKKWDKSFDPTWFERLELRGNEALELESTLVPLMLLLLHWLLWLFFPFRFLMIMHNTQHRASSPSIYSLQSCSFPGHPTYIHICQLKHLLLLLLHYLCMDDWLLYFAPYILKSSLLTPLKNTNPFQLFT